MIGTVLILLAHDLAVAFKNKTLYLVVSVPVLVYGSLALVDSTNTHAVPVRIALLRSGSYAPGLVAGITGARDGFSVRWTADEGAATRELDAHEVEGVLVPHPDDAGRVVLKVARQTSASTLAILQRVSALQDAAEGRDPGWISAVLPLQGGSIQRQTLPTWIVMMVLLVSFIVLPAQVAEEKEKQLLLGWLQTPVRESTWLAAKLGYGIVLALVSVVALQAMAGEPACERGMSYLAMLGAGSFCFVSLGICLGLLCRNQASARTLGVLCYLPLLLPVALSDLSHGLRRIVPLIPSYQFHEPIRAMLLENSGLESFARAATGLVAIGLLACLASHRLICRRWLMQ